MLLLKITVSGCLLAYLFSVADIDQFVSRITSLSPEFVVFGWFYYAICQWISAYRWQQFLTAEGANVPVGKLFNFYMIGMFLNNFIPGGLGGDVVKGYRLHQTINNTNLAIVSVFLERLTGLLGLTLIAVLATPFNLVKLQSDVTLLAVAGSVVFLLMVVLFIWCPPMARFNLWLAKTVFPHAFYEKLSQLYLALYSFRKHRKTLASATLISAVLQLMFAFYYALAAQALHIQIDFIYFVLFLPAITIITMVPLSIGGLGLREAVMISLFGSIGVSSADVLSISLSVYSINLLLSLFGGLLLLQGSFSRSR
jgi:hypothetical protein